MRTFLNKLKFFLCYLLLFLCQPVWAQELSIEGTPPNALQNKYYYFKPVVKNNAGAVEFSITEKPEWADFNSSTGELTSITGTPVYPLNEHVGPYNNIKITVKEKASGVSAVLGPFSIVVGNVNDSPVLTDSDGKTITKDSLPSVSEDLGPSVKENTEFIYKIKAQDEDLKLNIGEDLTFEIIGKPSWLDVIPGTSDINTGTMNATIKGTPGDEHAGSTYSIKIVVSDEKNFRSVAGPFDLYVKNVNDNPAISGTPPSTATQGKTYSFIPDYVDKDLNLTQSFDDNIVFSIAFGADGSGTMPEWLSFDPSSGALTNIAGRPNNDDTGMVKNIVISISDSLPDETIDASLPAFDICVQNANDAPTVQAEWTVPSIQSGEIPTVDQITGSVAEGEVLSISFTAEDIDLALKDRECVIIEDDIKYIAYNLPSWTKLVRDTANPLKAKLVNVANRPNNGDVGPEQNIEIMVIDGLGGVARLDKFRINVQNINDAPCLIQIPTQVINLKEDQPIKFMPVVKEVNDDMPKSEKECIENFSDDTVSDGTETDIIKANDIDVNYGDKLNIYLDPANKPEWLNIEPITNTEARLTGIPGNPNSSKDVYKDVKIIVEDRTEGDSDRLTAEYTFTIEVENENKPPVFTQAPPNETHIKLDAGDPFPEDYQIVKAEDYDPGDEVTYSISPASGWLLIDSAGNLSGKPTNGHAGINKITITATDNSGLTEIWPFTVDVKFVNTGPEISGITDDLSEPVSFVDISKPLIADEDAGFPNNIYIMKVNDPDVQYGDELSYMLENAPSWLSLHKDSKQNAVFSGTPLLEDVGTTTGIKITVTDKAGVSDFIVFNLQVNEVNDNPVIMGVLPVAVVGRNYYFKPYAYDEESSVLTFETDLPEGYWLTMVNPSTGELRGVPKKEHIGNQEFTIDVYDGTDGHSKLGPLTLKVIGYDLSVVPGDIDATGSVDLKDCIIGLQILTNTQLTISISKEADMDGDRILGMKEVIYILRKTAGIAGK